MESVTVSEDEVDSAYEKSKHRFPAVLESEVKYRIRRKLEDNRRADALKQLLSKLRRSAKVRNFLLEGSPKRHRLAAPGRPLPGSVGGSSHHCGVQRLRVPLLPKAAADPPPGPGAVAESMCGWSTSTFPWNRHRHAFGASKAAVCADRQGRFWEFHDALYRDGQDMSPQGVVAVAEALGLELGAV